MPKGCVADVLEARNAKKAHEALKSFDPKVHKPELSLFAMSSIHESVALKSLEMLADHWEGFRDVELLKRAASSDHESVRDRALEIMIGKIGGIDREIPEELHGVKLGHDGKIDYLLGYKKSGGDHEAGLEAFKNSRTEGLNPSDKTAYWTMKRVDNGELEDPEIPDEIDGEKLGSVGRMMFLINWARGGGSVEAAIEAHRIARQVRHY